MKQRIRNSPPIKHIIREYMHSKGDPVSFGEIYEHVSKLATLVSKTPRNSVFSVLTRMPDIERVSHAKYKLTAK
jgi:hypothetical protein